MAGVPLVLGVDGGTTKTIALVAHLDGTIAGAGRGGCSNMYACAEPGEALSAVEAAVSDALRAAHARPADLLAGGFSLSGADWPEDFTYWQEAMVQRGYGRTVAVTNDAIGPLWAGSPDGTGLAVVCGTGAAIGARAPDGQTWHTGFWPSVSGAVDLGRQALQAIYRAELGIDPPTGLAAPILAYFGCRTVEEVLHRLTARISDRPVHRIGGLARLLLDEAHRGDEVALRIVRTQGAALGDYALAAARRVGLRHGAVPLVLAGGVLRPPCHELEEAIAARVRTALPEVRVLKSQVEPVAGALVLALHAAGAAIDALPRSRIAATFPPPELFDTWGEP
jgi:N-acetylglucosamine kinase-like BadF-type ATPase